MMNFAVVRKSLAVTVLVSVWGAGAAHAADFSGYFHPDTHVLMVNATLTPLPGTDRVVFVKGEQLTSLAQERKMIAQHVPKCTLRLRDSSPVFRDTLVFLPHESSGKKSGAQPLNVFLAYSTDDITQPARDLKCVYLPNRSLYVTDINKILGGSMDFLDYPNTDRLLRIIADEAKENASNQSTRNESGRVDESVVVENNNQSSAGSASN